MKMTAQTVQIVVDSPQEAAQEQPIQTIAAQEQPLPAPQQTSPAYGGSGEAIVLALIVAMSLRK